jgi:Fibronectin type III domain
MRGRGRRQGNELSGFGFPEQPTAVEACDLDSCYSNNRPSVTDLYCRGHGRPLPIIDVQVGARVLLAVVSTLIIWGCFEWTAQTGSWVPVFVVFLAIFLGYVALPLRHFPRTAMITVLLWLTGSFAVFISRVTPGGFQVISCAVVVVCAAAVLAVYAIAGSSRMIRYRSSDLDYQEVVQMIAAAWIVAAWSALAALLVHYDGSILPGPESSLVTVMFIIAVIFTAIGVLIVAVSGAVLGIGGVQTQVPKISRPARPRWVMPVLHQPAPRTYHPGNAVDLMIDTFTRALYLAAVAAGNALVMIGRVTANCIALTAWALTSAAIAMTNLMIRFAILTFRWARAAIVAAARISRHAAAAAFRGIFDSVVSVLVPVTALLVTPWLVLEAAAQSRRYLQHGPLPALGSLVILLLAVSVLLLGTWVILANQHPRESLRSAGLSIPVTTGYGVVFLLFSSWVLGALGEFGYGHIRFGLITYVLSGAAVIALVFRRMSRRDEQHAPATAAPHPGAQHGYAWTAVVALVMIAGTAAGLAVFPPPGPVARPAGLAASARTTTSVTITWSRPKSGPSPTEYVIEQGGKAIAVVPGTATTYRATKLAPATTYTYQVIAVRGALRSPPSTALTTRTLTPPAWQAALTGQWTVHYANITTNAATTPNLTTDTWTLTSTCAASQCPVTVAGAFDSYAFTATLRLSGQLYVSQPADLTYFYCGSAPMPGTVTVKIAALAGEVTAGRWVATSWNGSVLIDAPTVSKCADTTLSATVSAPGS